MPRIPNMLLATKEIHDRVSQLGEALRFVVTRQVSDSLLRLRLDEAYKPRIDLLWSVPLDREKRQAIAQVLEWELVDVTHLPGGRYRGGRDDSDHQNDGC